MFTTDVKYQLIKNPDSSYVKEIKKRLKANNNYCPCKPEKTPDTKCPCADYRDNGNCDCGMYILVPIYED